MTEKTSEIRQIQEIELDILKEFQKICTRHNLQYFAIGGTCIGAVRHHGFIPWDDDIDVAMPYKDYIKLIKIAPKELPKKYKLYLPEENKHWDYNFIKIHNAETTFVEKDCSEYRDRYSGVYIDVMPIYGMGKTKVVQKVESIWCDINLYLNRRQRFSYHHQPSVSSKVIWIMNAYNYFTKDYDYFIKKLHHYFSKYEFDYSDKVMFGWRRRPSRFRPSYKYKNVFEYKDFCDTTVMPFEDTEINVPIGYDNYLKMDFGNYMKLPSKEQQKARHEVDILDLSKSYEIYRGDKEW